MVNPLRLATDAEKDDDQREFNKALTAAVGGQPGPRPEDGVWATYWYSTVHQSSGFQATKTALPVVEDQYQPLLQQALPLYESLLSKDLTL